MTAARTGLQSRQGIENESAATAVLTADPVADTRFEGADRMGGAIRNRH